MIFFLLRLTVIIGEILVGIPDGHPVQDGDQASEKKDDGIIEVRTQEQDVEDGDESIKRSNSETDLSLRQGQSLLVVQIVQPECKVASDGIGNEGEQIRGDRLLRQGDGQPYRPFFWKFIDIRGDRLLPKFGELSRGQGMGIVRIEELIEGLEFQFQVGRSIGLRPLYTDLSHLSLLCVPEASRRVPRARMAAVTVLL